MMKKIVVALILLIFAYSMSVYAIEPKTGEDGGQTELSPIEKKVWDIFEKTKEYGYSENALIRELVNLGEDAAPTLFKELYNNNLKIAALSAYALDELYGEKILSKIVKANSRHILKDHNCKIGWLVQKYGDKSLPYLKTELETQETDVRHDLILLIAYIDTENSVKLLNTWFKEEKSNKLKLRIIDFAYPKSKDEEAKKEYQEFISKLLAGEDVKLKCEAIATLGIIKEAELLISLVELAVDKELCVRSAAMKALCKIGSPNAIEAVIKNLKHECEKTRAEAADELSNIINIDELVKDKIVDALLDALADKDKQVRISVIVSLSVFSDLDAVKQLEEIAKNDPDEEVRNEAAEAIEDIKRSNDCWDDDEETDDDDESDSEDSDDDE